MRNRRKLVLALALSSLFAAAPALADSKDDGAAVRHVLLISVDGMHKSDLDWFVATHPGSAMARLVQGGTSFTNAQTPFPSDSFPGLIAQATGGNPATTGIYYDDAFSRDLLPVGTSTANCKGTPKGAEVNYSEAIARDSARIDSGQGIPGLYAGGKTDLTKIFALTGRAVDLIDSTQLPVDPKSCSPVYPHQYLRVNTVFEVAHQHGLRTAWSDKHAAYEILNGPSGNGVDDLFAPEINSNVADPGSFGAPGTADYGSGPDWTKNNVNTQRYDAVKAAAVVNWLAGHDHAGQGNFPVPAILGMNFQSVSTAQKLNKSDYFVDPANPIATLPGLGGYVDGATPGPVVQSALQFVDDQLQTMLTAANPRDTAIILSAKHGQSPQNRADLTIINDGDMIDALNAAWDPNLASDGKLPLVAHAMDDDGIILWLNDRSETALRFVNQFLWAYSGTGVGSDAQGNKIAKPFVHAGVRQLLAGKDVRDLFGAPAYDGRVPDVIGIAQQGTVYAGSKLSKIAEHGGAAQQDRDVPIVVWGPGIARASIDAPVETTQIAPTIVQLLGFDPEELDAVRVEGTPSLPLAD